MSTRVCFTLFHTCSVFFSPNLKPMFSLTDPVPSPFSEFKSSHSPQRSPLACTHVHPPRPPTRSPPIRRVFFRENQAAPSAMGSSNRIRSQKAASVPRAHTTPTPAVSHFSTLLPPTERSDRPGPRGRLVPLAAPVPYVASEFESARFQAQPPSPPSAPARRLAPRIPGDPV